MRSYSAWLQKYCLILSALSVFAFGWGSYYTVQLYKNLRADIEELLPESAPSVQDLKKAQGRVVGLNHLEVVIESKDLDAAKRFQLDLTRKLQALPSQIVGKVKSDITAERKFFDAYKVLYLDLADWQRIYRFVKKKINKQTFDLGLLEEEEPSFDPKVLEDKYKKRTEGFSHFKDDLFQSKDGHTKIILAFLPGKVTGMAGNKALSDAAKALIDELNPKSYAPDLVVGLGGDVQNVVEEHHGLVYDLISSFVIVTILVTLVLAAFYQSFGAVISLSFSLFLGVALTFGLSYFAVGYLNANTAFLGSIVIGNGINCGVIYLARYMEERRNGVDPLTACETSLAGTYRATLTAALAAGVAYGSLTTTQFRGFNQFGVIGALGMMLCWLSAYSLLPAYLFVWEKILPAKSQPRLLNFPLLRWVTVLIERNFRAISYLSMMLACVALVGVLRLSQNTIESDLSKLRNKESMLHGSGFWGAKTDSIFGRTLTPTMVLTNSPEETKLVYKRLKEIHEREGGFSPFSQISIVDDFLPDHQDRKLALMTDLKKILTPKVQEKLSPKERKWIQDFLPDPLPRAIRIQDLPKDLLMPFAEANGKLGNVLHVYPRAISKENSVAGTWDGKEVIRYTELLRMGIQDSGVDAVIAGQPPVSADMLSAINRDGPKATVVAFIAVVLLTLLMFPNFKHFGSIVLALVYGILLMIGVMGALKWKINFLNFITLPITFGIGVDYAVNIFGRYHEERKGRRSIAHVIRTTGGAVVLCSTTTIIGYGSLLLSGSQAFVSFGRLAVLGEFACILAAVISLPAIWMYLQRTRA